ncbi:MAG: AraC family transcriptional regulator [Spirochaetota bacterium]
MDARAIAVRVFNRGLAGCRSDWRLDEEGALTHRLYFIRGGNATYDDGTRQRLMHRHLYIFPSNTKYSITHDPRDPLSVVFFYAAFLPDIANPLIDVDLAACEPLNALGEWLYQTYAARMGSSVMEEFVVAQILSLVSSVVPLVPIADARILGVLERINKAPSAPLSLAELAGTAGLERHYFVTLFKKVTGTTPMRYIAGRRLEESRRLISTGRSVRDASREAGFSDEKSFSRLFKRVYGLAPSVLAREHGRY